MLSYEVEKGNDMSDKYFVLKNDIDLSGKEWTPIGVSDKYISNKYQGNAFNGRAAIFRHFSELRKKMR